MSQRVIDKPGWDVTYQIYPSSFNEGRDREPTGVGSISGITEKLHYLEELGVDAIWISPFFASPMKDGGYDIADATEVDPVFGTNADADKLIQQAHEIGIKVIIDFIPNHTSDQHAWFQESMLSRDNPKSDWYIWSDGIIDKDGNRQPPNNWASVFSISQIEARAQGKIPDLTDDDLTPPKSAWTWCKNRQQYYLHSFADFQPDLNWDNPEVRQALKDVMRHWLDRGVDGFRVDAVNYIGKNPDRLNEARNTAYRDGKDNPYDQWRRFNSSGYMLKLLPYMKELTDVLEEPLYKDRDLKIIFEAYMEPQDLKLIDHINPQLASSFNFGRLDLLTAPALIQKLHLDAYYASLPKGAKANQVTGNHDKPRIADVLGAEASRAMMLFNMMLPGQTFLYNGEELGLTGHKSIPPNRIKDPNGLRDASRTPMPWDDTRPNAGFSDADESQLYLPVNPEDLSKSVRSQVSDPKSDLSLTKKAIQLKKQIGATNYHPLSVSDTEGGASHGVIAYGVSGRTKALTVKNFSGEVRRVRIDSLHSLGNLAISSHQAEGLTEKDEVSLQDIILQPHQALVFTDLQ